MAKGAPEPQQQSGDRSLDFLWLIVLIVGGILLIWYFGKVYISMGVFKVKLYEIAAVEFFAKYWLGLAKILNWPVPNLQILHDCKTIIHSSYGSAVEFKLLSDLSLAVGNFIRFPVIAILLGLGAVLCIGGGAQRYRTTYTMNQFKMEEHENWPQITPVVKLELTKTPLDKLPWAMAQDPMRFCKKYNLLQEEVKKDGKTTVTLKRGVAYRVLSLQLGPRWRGVEFLPDYLQALFAIFAARINGEKQIAEELIDKIAASSVNGKPEFFNAREILLKHVNAKRVVKVVSLHGYVTTVMASLLSAAREVGVVSTSEFIWLKAIDRRMWYMLNSVGRYTAVSEIAGAFAHWLAEKKLGLPLMVPMVEEAVKGLEVALSEVLYKPDEEA